MNSIFIRCDSNEEKTSRADTPNQICLNIILAIKLAVISEPSEHLILSRARRLRCIVVLGRTYLEADAAEGSSLLAHVC